MYIVAVIVVIIMLAVVVAVVVLVIKYTRVCKYDHFYDILY